MFAHSLLSLSSHFFDDDDLSNNNNVIIKNNERRGGQPSSFLSSFLSWTWTSDSNKSKVVGVGVGVVHGDPTVSLFCFLLIFMLLSKKNIRRWRGSFCTSKKTTLSLSHL